MGWRATASLMVKAAARAADPILARPGWVVLAYHRVGAGTGTEMDLPVGEFRRQMEWLAHQGTVGSLDDALTCLESGDPRPGVVLTFDDGTSDFARNVVPVLDSLRLPATLYLTTGPVLSGRCWPDGAAPLTWDALGEVASVPGVTIGAHSHDHLLFDRIDEGTAAADLDRCLSAIAEHLGEVPWHFAYPKALAPAPGPERAVRERFRSAALSGCRANRPAHVDRYRLHRTPVQASDAPRHFESKALGGMRLEAELRRAANVIRYRGRAT